MLAEQVAQQTAQGDQAIQDILSQPVVSGQLQIFFGQLFRPPALGVLAGGQQLFLTALQDLTDALEQGDVRVGQPQLPFADRGVGDKETLGEFLLGHAQLFAPLADEGAK